jgi:hypothetical protein
MTGNMSFLNPNGTNSIVERSKEEGLEKTTSKRIKID